MARTLRLVTLVALLALVAAACGDDDAASPGGGDSGFPETARTAFMDGCTEDDASLEPVCICALDEFEKTYTLADFLDLQSSFESSDGPPDDVLQIILGCALRSSE